MIENERKTFPTCLPGKHSRKRGMLLFVGGCSQGWDISVPSPLSPPPTPLLLLFTLVDYIEYSLIPTFSFHQCVARIRLPGIHWHSETSERGKPASFEPASYGSTRVLCAGSARIQNVRISRSRPFAKLSRARFVRRLLKRELGVCGYSKQQSDSHL